MSQYLGNGTTYNTNMITKTTGNHVIDRMTRYK